MDRTWDLLVKGATVFDGTGAPPRRVDVGVRDGRIEAVAADLPADAAAEVVAAQGQWLLPGLLDVHTHFDLEVELAPGLPEAVRHGTTTVVTANCSLGLAFGNQRHTGSDPIVDCFARVENIPKPVLARAADVATWREPAAYLDHLDTLPLGPNVVTMMPHSMLRIEVMGLDAAISREPTDTELTRMKALVGAGLDAGYAGFSTDALPFHYLANDPHRKRKIPTQYATFRELRALTEEARARGRVWQTTPPKDNPLASLRNFSLSSGRLWGRGTPLKVTAVAAMDVVPNGMLFRMARTITTLLNSRLLGGRFFLQALAARFKVWSDGVVSPLSEEVDVLRAVNEQDLDDREGRARVMADPAWQARFRAWWWSGKSLRTPIAWLKRRLRYEKEQLSRKLEDMVVERCPVEVWHGESFRAVHDRLTTWQTTGIGARSPEEAEAFARFPHRCDEADLVITLLRTFDTDLVWWCISANADEATVERILLDERFLPGFADSGAHITNMAFYDANLRALRHAQRHGEAGVARMVHRLTRQPADFFGVDAGRLEPGAQADLVLVDPAALAAYEGEAHVTRIFRDVFQHEQLVNRSDGVVRQVFIAGRRAWDGSATTPELGTVPMGRLLRAGEAAPVPAAQAAK